MRLNSRKAKVESRKAKGGSIVVAICILSYVVSGFSRTAIAQQYTFEEVAAGLKHQDAATRLRAIQILRDADYAEAAAPIGDLLGDAEDRVQMAAIEAERALFLLRPISRREKVGFIFEKRTTIGHDAAEGRLALKPRRIPPQVLAGLVIALSDSNPRVRAEAIALAALLGPAACLPARELPPGRTPAGAGPADRGQCPLVGNALVENINSREPAIRRSAMQALGRMRYANAVQALLDQYSYYQKGPDASAAIGALAGIGHVASVSAFEPLLTSPDADLRRLAIEGTARAGHRDALPALQQMGASEQSAAVLLALHFAHIALGAPGSSVAEIVSAARDRALRPLAVQYLLDLAPVHAPALSESLRDSDPEARRLAADVLGFSGDPSVAPALAAAAKDADPAVALAAERALERLKL